MKLVTISFYFLNNLTKEKEKKRLLDDAENMLDNMSDAQSEPEEEIYDDGTTQTRIKLITVLLTSYSPIFTFFLRFMVNPH